MFQNSTLFGTTLLLLKIVPNISIFGLSIFVSLANILQTVKDLGIDYSQGYYFSEPKEEKFMFDN